MIRKINIAHVFKLSNAKEWIDEPTIIQQKTKKLAEMIKNAKYPILFTGAGISTSVGIPDYRSGSQTVVATGPGIWNRDLKANPPKQRIDQIVDEAIPSLTHMGIKTLLNKGIFKYLVSQNTDGLHLKSGVDINKIAQLHGNRNLEKCIKCQHVYLRDFRTIKRDNKREGKHSHETGRDCQNCGGDLIDSIIYFGQKLPSKDLTNAFRQAATCDLLICIGSSLTVMPSANVPVLALKNGANLGIINIQQTAFDKAATIKINSFCDPVVDQLMKQLDMEIDPYIIQHYLQMHIKGRTLKLQGKDMSRNNFTFIKSVKYDGKEYTPKGHQIQIAIGHEYDVCINLYGSKTPFILHLQDYYKLFHGQQVFVKICKKQGQNDWTFQQI